MSIARANARAQLGELAAFGLLTGLGLVMVVSGYGYGFLLEGNRVGPGFLPTVLGLLLLLLSGGQLASRLVRPHRRAASVPADGQPSGVVTSGTPSSQRSTRPEQPREEPEEPETDVLGRTQGDRVRQLRLVIGAIFVTVVLAPYLGFLLAFGLLMVFISVVVEGRPPLPSIVITVAAVAIVYGVFSVFLGVPLPTGLPGSLTGG